MSHPDFLMITTSPAGAHRKIQHKHLFRAPREKDVYVEFFCVPPQVGIQRN